MLKLSNSIKVFIYLFSSLVFISCGNKDEIKDEQSESKSTTKNSKVLKSKVVTPENSQFSYKVGKYSATALGEACFRGDLQKVKNLVQKGATIDTCLSYDLYDYDLLYASLAFNQIEIAEYVLNNEIYKNINQLYLEYNNCPLTMACELSNENDALRIAEILIIKGANVNGEGHDKEQYFFQRPIIRATKKNYPKVVKLLLDHGADKKVTYEGDTPLDIAEMGGYWEIISLLSEKISYSKYTEYKNALFGFSFEYPELFTQKQPSKDGNYKTAVLPDSEDGINLISPDYNIEIIVNGYEHSGQTVSDEYEFTLSHYTKSNAAYKVQKGNWFAISWVDSTYRGEPKIGYLKKVVGKKQINSLMIRYPYHDKKHYDEMVNRVIKSFKSPLFNE